MTLLRTKTLKGSAEPATIFTPESTEVSNQSVLATWRAHGPSRLALAANRPRPVRTELAAVTKYCDTDESLAQSSQKSTYFFSPQ